MTQKDKDIPIVVVEATPLFQTTMRQKITPYLPPPMVMAMRNIDPQLEPYIGPEASMTLLGSFGLALVLWQLLVRTMGGKGKSGGKAIQLDDDDDEFVHDSQNNTPFDATVLLCGPPFAGKTSLFYQLVYPTLQQQLLQTVLSIKPNAGFVVDDSTAKTWRYLDTPGHWGATKLVSTVLDKESSIDRIIVVLDATQPVTKAADYLYAILQHSTKNNNKKIMVACHKSNLPKAKNLRRLKLQLRTELERMAKLDTATTTFDAEECLKSQVGFVNTSVEDSSNPPVLDELKAFLSTGEL